MEKISKKIYARVGKLIAFFTLWAFLISNTSFASQNNTYLLCLLRPMPHAEKIINETPFGNAQISEVNLGNHSQVLITVPKAEGTTVEEQIRSLLRDIERALRSSGLDHTRVVKQTIYMKSTSQAETVKKILSEFYGGVIPATDFVQQPPINGDHLSIQLLAIGGEDVGVKRCNEYMTVVRTGNMKWAHLGGVVPNAALTDTYEQAADCFLKMKTLLESEGFKYENVLRTWLYQRNIYGRDPDGQERYNKLNRARKDFYKPSGEGSQPIKFGDGFVLIDLDGNKITTPTIVPPASTGIGMQADSFVTGAIALMPAEGVKVQFLENPRQISAFAYQPGVQHGLVGETAPMFSRGIAVVFGDYKIIYVSGTASIVQSETMHIGDVQKQTQTTLDNINLVLNQAGASLKNAIQLTVYIKNPQDYEIVKEEVQRRCGSVPCVYVIADICRENLLVEIEVVAGFLHRTPSWIQEHAPLLVGKKVASFCMEGCIYEFSPAARDANFAGGLGIVNIDELEGELKIGLDAMTFMPVYFKRRVQKIKYGKQVIEVVDVSYENEPLEMVKDKDGNLMAFNVWHWDVNDTSRERPYYTEIRKVKGKPIYVVWQPEIYDLVYTDDINRRFIQETFFGKCMYEFFYRANFVPDICHINEGHVANVLPAMSNFSQFEKTGVVYVNHSIEAYSIQRFHIPGLDGGDARWIRWHGIPSFNNWQEYWQAFTTPDGYIDMSRGALHRADIAAGVSNEHAIKTKELFPWYKGEIIPVLNGSGDFWVSEDLLKIEKEGRIPTREEFNRIHREEKMRAFALIKERTKDMTNALGNLISPDGIELDLFKPTVWLVRRLTEYKSQMPILRDIIRVICAERNEIVDTKWGKMKGLGMQVVVGGLTVEEGPMQWIEEFTRWMEEPQLKGKFVFVPGGGSELLEAQAKGADICLNCPLPRREACGTSDQRTARNRGYTISMHSGGPPEIYEHRKSGSLLGPYKTDAEFYEKAPKDVLDELAFCANAYYASASGDTKWDDMLDGSYIASREVTSEAMAKRYVRKVYKPALALRGVTIISRTSAAVVQATQELMSSILRPVSAADRLF